MDKKTQTRLYQLLEHILISIEDRDISSARSQLEYLIEKVKFNQI